MGRYRPPRKRSSTYITPEGAQALREELHQLWKVERPQVTDAVHEAAKNGDRSENGDYIYGKRRLREIDSRVRFLNKRLDELKVVTRLPADKDKVFFGAWVTLQNKVGEQQRWRIVGPDEFDLSERKLSMDSPLARAMLGKRLHDLVTVQSPSGEQRYSVTVIQYIDHIETGPG
ncbi:MAG: transcription elongation factor GreB [Halioglobus sp.]|nr:transcription elongation factor GreB [Halioglobus sp.]